MKRRRRRRTLREGSLEEKAAVTNVRTGGAHCLTLITGVPSSSSSSSTVQILNLEHDGHFKTEVH